MSSSGEEEDEKAQFLRFRPMVVEERPCSQSVVTVYRDGSSIEPGQTFGTMNINEVRRNSWMAQGSDDMASAPGMATVSGVGGDARRLVMPGMLSDMERGNSSMAASGRGDRGADVGNSMGAGVGHRGMIPNMNSNGGYRGMASGLAPGSGPGLGQMGLPRPGPSGLAPAANLIAQTQASHRVISSHRDGLSPSLTLSPVSKYGEERSKREERGRIDDGPGEEGQERRSQKRMMENKEEASSSRARKHGDTDNRGVKPNVNSNFGYSGMASAPPQGLIQLGLHQAGATRIAPAPHFPATQSGASDGLVTIASHSNLLGLSAVGSHGLDMSKKLQQQGFLNRRMRRKETNRESAEKSREKKRAENRQREEEANRLIEKKRRLEEEKRQLEEENNRLEEDNRQLREETNNLSKDNESLKIIIERLSGSESIESPLQPDGNKKVE